MAAGVQRKQPISSNFQGRTPRHQASRQSWSVAIRNFLTSPFPFDCSGLLGSGKCCSVIISCGCGCRPVWCARIGAKSFFPVDEHSTVGARASQSPLRAPAVLLGASWCYLVLLGLRGRPRQDTATQVARSPSGRHFSDTKWLRLPPILLSLPRDHLHFLSEAELPLVYSFLLLCISIKLHAELADQQ